MPVCAGSNKFSFSKTMCNRMAYGSWASEFCCERSWKPAKIKKLVRRPELVALLTLFSHHFCWLYFPLLDYVISKLNPLNVLIMLLVISCSFLEWFKYIMCFLMVESLLRRCRFVSKSLSTNSKKHLRFSKKRNGIFGNVTYVIHLF